MQGAQNFINSIPLNRLKQGPLRQLIESIVRAVLAQVGLDAAATPSPGMGYVRAVTVPDRAAFVALRSQLAASGGPEVPVQVTILSDEGDPHEPGRLNIYDCSKTRALKRAYVADDDDAP